MTDEPSANDSIEPGEAAEARRADGGVDHDDGGLDGRTLLGGAAGALLGLLGLGATSGTAKAAGSRKRLLVVADGSGRHEYEIEMESGGSIRKERHAGSNDSVGSTAGGNQRVEGVVWHRALDSYTFTGDVEAVTADGSLSFHFLDGAFTGQGSLDIRGQSSGRHVYEIGSNSADIDLDSGSTEYVDSDDGPGRTERGWTPDSVSGALRDSNHDRYGFGYYEPIQNISVEDGHLRFS